MQAYTGTARIKSGSSGVEPPWDGGRASFRRRILRGIAVAVALASGGAAAAGCDGESSPGPERRAVLVYFSLDERPVPVPRIVSPSKRTLPAALEALLSGPTPVERSRGVTSFFSRATASALRSARVDSAGRAIVDFHDLRPVIPGASSSAGSAGLLAELNHTVFQFPEIRSVEYRMEGSCDLFWEWLQRACRIVPRDRVSSP